VGAQVLGDRHDVVARHHQGLAGAGAVAAAFLEHGGKFIPGFGRRMLAAEFALAMTPPRGRNHRRDARVDAAAIDRDRGAEA
jgi:hypothetical protein